MPDLAKDGTVRLDTANASLRRRGYRGYVGGNSGQWERIGKLQFDFLVSQGLRPSHVLLDIACGSLRAGRHFIPWLDPGHYLGLDVERDLIDAGLANELSADDVSERRPEFVVSDCFEFSKFSKSADFAIANSLFTHLVPADIVRCFSNFADYAGERAVLFGTFFISAQRHANPTASDAHQGFFYTRDEIDAMAKASGLTATYVGDWGHPRGQKMVMFQLVDSVAPASFVTELMSPLRDMARIVRTRLKPLIRKFPPLAEVGR